MILVDTSVFIHYFHNHSTRGAAYLEQLVCQKNEFGINEYIYQELLQGAGMIKSLPRSKNIFLTCRSIP